jgi:hypothetical protein
MMWTFSPDSFPPVSSSMYVRRHQRYVMLRKYCTLLNEVMAAVVSSTFRNYFSTSLKCMRTVFRNLSVSRETNSDSFGIM